MKRYQVIATDDEGTEHTWDCDTINAARELLRKIGVEGFYLNDANGEGCTFVFPHCLRRLRAGLHPGLLCERCHTVEKLRGERFCKECKKVALEEMRANGYLQDVPPATPPMPFARRSTKPREEGAWDNAVRSVEGDT